MGQWPRLWFTFIIFVFKSVFFFPLHSSFLNTQNNIKQTKNYVYVLLYTVYLYMLYRFVKKCILYLICAVTLYFNGAHVVSFENIISNRNLQILNCIFCFFSWISFSWNWLPSYFMVEIFLLAIKIRNYSRKKNLYFHCSNIS